MPATDYRESLSTLVPIALASRFYPRDAMLVRVLAMALCPCLCLCPSITSRCSVETNGQNNLVFGMGASFDQSYTGTSLWNFFLNSGLRKFRHGISIVERAINLARERWTLTA